MLYLGIDIGKNNHEARIVNSDGSHKGKSLRFGNTSEGFDKLLQFITAKNLAGEKLRIGMEATGHYWLALYSFLHKQGISISVINGMDCLSAGFFAQFPERHPVVDEKERGLTEWTPVAHIPVK